ncbi:hypothetical protein IV203_015983 [Nitzschia inconspicua]|uniref:Uncharacterized protein n=1 Tax=Nitzschia inconspicua TaxID=303405 RepID=A0A9K3PH82_9STRA|nr:hypothetical protein IV203_015983 [Nitzschia inconspicua]
MKLFGLSLVLALASSALTIVVSAVKDDEYYRAGMGNPNVDLKMYWADAHNVLEDLSQFSTLYVQYHHCAWAQNQNHYSGEEEGGSGDENDYWYVGATPSFAANVAYSLYGSLKGESFTGCNGDTFINSFTTNSGFEAFASALYYAGATSTDYSQKYSSECQGGAGVACDYNVGFAYVSFSTSTCDPKYANGVSDNMGYMNSDFQSAQCVKIYDASQYSYSNNNNGYNNNNGNGGNYAANYYYNNGYNNAYSNSYNSYYQYYGTPLALLYYSNACFIQNFWAPNGGCPDPYGKLQYYQQNFNKGVRKSLKVDPYVNYRANMEKGKKFVKMGAIFFMAAALLYLFEQFMAFRKRMRPATLQKSPAVMNKHLVGKDGDKTLLKASEGMKKNRSIVGLVRSATGKMKEAVKAAVATTRSKDTIDDVARLEGDGIMLTDPQDTTNGLTGSYTAPEAAAVATSDVSNIAKNQEDAVGSKTAPIEATSSDESAVKVDMPTNTPLTSSKGKGNSRTLFRKGKN